MSRRCSLSEGALWKKYLSALFTFANNVKNVFFPSLLAKLEPCRPFSAKLNSHYFSFDRNGVSFYDLAVEIKTLLQQWLLIGVLPIPCTTFSLQFFKWQTLQDIKEYYEIGAKSGIRKRLMMKWMGLAARQWLSIANLALSRRPSNDFDSKLNIKFIGLASAMAVISDMRSFVVQLHTVLIEDLWKSFKESGMMPISYPGIKVKFQSSFYEIVTLNISLPLSCNFLKIQN